MHPEVLRPVLRPLYRIPGALVVALLGGIAAGAGVLTMAVALVYTFDAAMTPQVPWKAPVLAQPTHEEPELSFALSANNYGLYMFSTGSVTNLQSYVFLGSHNNKIVFSVDDTGAVAARGNTSMGDSPEDVHTFHGTLVIRRHDEDKECTITMDPLSGISRECDDEREGMWQ